MTNTVYDMNDPRTDTRSDQLVMLDQQLALGAYLNALLRPAPAEVVAAVAPASATLAEPEIPAAAIHQAETELPRVAAGLQTAEPAARSAAVPASVPATAGPPDWAQSDFQCLLFRIAGLTLALPLAKLNGVLPWDAAAVTPLPNHRSWFLGLREHLGQQVKLIDVAKVVLPPERWPAPDAALHGKIILIDDGRWGLVCSEVAEVVTLAADAVKWRSRAGGRAWLAGTMIDRMCALLDSAALAGMLGGDGPQGP